MKSAPIYVEIRLRGSMDELWRLTQTPDVHQRWDLRFTNIEYLPRIDPSQPQRFLYATRIGFGLRIAGVGESAGDNNGDSMEFRSPIGRANQSGDAESGDDRAGPGGWIAQRDLPTSRKCLRRPPDGER